MATSKKIFYSIVLVGTILLISSNLKAEGEGFSYIDDGVYYNKYMSGRKIKMPKVLYKGLVDYADGTEATEQQLSLIHISEPTRPY